MFNKPRELSVLYNECEKVKVPKSGFRACMLGHTLCATPAMRRKPACRTKGHSRASLLAGH